MATQTYTKDYVKSNYATIYKTIGGQLPKLTELVKKLESVRDKWDEVVESGESFYSNFATDLDNLITHLSGYESYLETKASELDQYAKWAD